MLFFIMAFSRRTSYSVLTITYTLNFFLLDTFLHRGVRCTQWGLWVSNFSSKWYIVQFNLFHSNTVQETAKMILQERAKIILQEISKMIFWYYLCFSVSAETRIVLFNSRLHKKSKTPRMDQHRVLLHLVGNADCWICHVRCCNCEYSPNA